MPESIIIEGDTTGGAQKTNARIKTFLTEVKNKNTETNVDNDAPNFLPLGVTKVTFTTKDEKGNMIGEEKVITVVDTNPPNLILPKNITIVSKEPVLKSDSRIESFLKSVSFIDVVDPGPTIKHDAPETFPFGTTTVTFTATDKSKNTITGPAKVEVKKEQEVDIGIKDVTPVPTVTSACLLKSKGDADCDGKINIIDFNIWRNEFFKITKTKTADFNNDKTVNDYGDFNIWQLSMLNPSLPH